MSKILGLTGGIACGKSTISAYLKEFGLPVIDADECSRAVIDQLLKKAQSDLKN